MPHPTHCAPKDRRLDRHIAQVPIAERQRRWHDWCLEAEMVHGCPWAAHAIAKKIGIFPVPISTWERGHRSPTMLTRWSLWTAALACDFPELPCEFVRDEAGRTPRLVRDRGDVHAGLREVN